MMKNVLTISHWLTLKMLALRGKICSDELVENFPLVFEELLD